MHQSETEPSVPEVPLWKVPAVLIILGTSFFSALTVFMIIPFLTIHLTSKGYLTLEQAGIVVGLSFWIKRGGAFFGGLAADRFGRRGMMILALGIRIPGYLLLAYGRDFFSLLLATVLISMGSALYTPSVKAALTHLSPPGSRGRIFALRIGMFNAGAAIGPFVGTLLLAYSAELMFVAAAVSMTVITLVNAFIPFSDGHKATGNSIEVVISMAKSPRMLRLMLFGVLFFMAYIQMETIFPILVKDTGHADKIGMLFGCWAAVVVAAQFVLSRFVLSMPRPACMFLGFSLFACGFLILHATSQATGPFLLGSVPLVASFFAAVSLFSVAEVMLDLRLDYDASFVPADRVGTSFGFINLACGLGGLLGSSLGTSAYKALASSHGMFSSVWMAMALLAVLSAVVLVRQEDEVPVHGPGGEQPPPATH